MPTPTTTNIPESVRAALLKNPAAALGSPLGPSPDHYCPDCDVFYAFADEHRFCPNAPTNGERR